MKSVIKEAKDVAPTEPEFPCLYKALHGGKGSYVVMFTEENIGYVVFTEINSVRVFNEFKDDWRSCTDAAYWQKFTGEIILSN